MSPLALMPSAPWQAWQAAASRARSGVCAATGGPAAARSPRRSRQHRERGVGAQIDSSSSFPSRRGRPLRLRLADRRQRRRGQARMGAQLEPRQTAMLANPHAVFSADPHWAAVDESSRLSALTVGADDRALRAADGGQRHDHRIGRAQLALRALALELAGRHGRDRELARGLRAVRGDRLPGALPARRLHRRAAGRHGLESMQYFTASPASAPSTAASAPKAQPISPSASGAGRRRRRRRFASARCSPFSARRRA